MVPKKDLIDGQRVLIVDDEPDVLNTLEDLLPTCDITTATTFEEAKEKGRHFWWRWLDRLGPFYDRTFGPDWKKKDEEFWKKLTYI